MSLAQPAPDATLRERLQRTLGANYVVNRELGGGGSAHVFLATELALERSVVLKVLPPALTDGVDGARFHREILIAARLQHPHLVPLLNAGEPNEHDAEHAGGPATLRWYTMPFVEGQTLRELLEKRGAVPLTEAVRLLREMASALAYAHAKGIIHRDIKPENVLLSDGVAMIADFGVAKALDDASAEAVASGRRVTTISMTLGTPAYMAPEQISNARVVDHKADLYAFGCVAYELLAGAPPFVRASHRATMAAQLTDQPVPLEARRAETPPTLAAIIMRCLEKDPRQRPHSASQVVQVLDALTTPSVAPSPVEPETHGARSEPRQAAPVSGRVALLLAIVGLLLAAALWWVTIGARS